MATDDYFMLDFMTEKVIYVRGQRRDSEEDVGHLEENGETEEMVFDSETEEELVDNDMEEILGDTDMEEMVVDNDIYESYDIGTGPQEDAYGRHAQGWRSKTVRGHLRVVALGLGMLCLVQLGVIIGQAVHYHSANKQLMTKYNKVILEKELSLTRYDNLTWERDRLQSEVTMLERERAVSCPSRWKKFGCSCYYTSTEKKTWEESRKQCLMTEADLVVINSKEEQEFIRGLIPGPDIGPWIGLKRTAGKWMWVDGTRLTTQYWASGQPDTNKYYNCARWGEGNWYYSRTCSPINIQKHYTNWICEKRCYS